jgi:hypothetical protein
MQSTWSQMAAGGTERTSGYFADQTPSESKKPVPHSVLSFLTHSTFATPT